MRMRDICRGIFPFLAVGLLLFGCGTDGGDGGGQGALSVSMVDATLPGAQAVYVTVDHVDVHPEGGTWATVLSPQKTVNLLELVNGLQENLGLADLAAGPYDQLRLVLGTTPDGSLNLQDQHHPFANYLIDDTGTVHELKVPSGLQTGVKLVGGFTIATATLTELILDFDAAASVVVAGNSGTYLLKPTIKVLASAATVTGTVTDETPAPLPDTLVSAQAGTTDPTVTTTLSDGDGRFALYLNPGDYQLVAYRPPTPDDAYLPACRPISLTTDQQLTGQDLVLAAAGQGNLSVTITIAGATADATARLSLRQTPPAPCTLPIELVNRSVVVNTAIDLPLPAGDYQLVVSPEGLASQTIAVTVNAGATTEQAVVF